MTIDRIEIQNELRGVFGIQTHRHSQLLHRGVHILDTITLEFAVGDVKSFELMKRHTERRVPSVFHRNNETSKNKFVNGGWVNFFFIHCFE